MASESPTDLRHHAHRPPDENPHPATAISRDRYRALLDSESLATNGSRPSILARVTVDPDGVDEADSLS
jgi:hypothetical protein